MIIYHTLTRPILDMSCSLLFHVDKNELTISRRTWFATFSTLFQHLNIFFGVTFHSQDSWFEHRNFNITELFLE